MICPRRYLKFPWPTTILYGGCRCCLPSTVYSGSNFTFKRLELEGWKLLVKRCPQPSHCPTQILCQFWSNFGKKLVWNPTLTFQQKPPELLNFDLILIIFEIEGRKLKLNGRGQSGLNSCNHPSWNHPVLYKPILGRFWWNLAWKSTVESRQLGS